MLRYVRFAVTALNLTACVLLIALWVRSYYWTDTFFVNFNARFYCVWIEGGELWFYVKPGPNKNVSGYTPYPVYAESFNPPPNILGFRVSDPTLVPYWFLAFTSGAVAVALWTKWSGRFRLRTLLIATTLAAVGLGMIVVAMQVRPTG